MKETYKGLLVNVQPSCSGTPQHFGGASTMRGQPRTAAVGRGASLSLEDRLCMLQGQSCGSHPRVLDDPRRL